MSVCTSACSSDKVARGDSLMAPRDSLPVMRTYGVTTLISDSGVTKFRVTAPEWEVFDKKVEPYWLFPEGVHFDKLADDMSVYAEVDADSAVYYNNLEKWILVGNVHVRNVNAESFDSEELIMEQKEDRVHTDKFITITQKERIINGVGFESNTRLTCYTILQPQGVFPVDAVDGAGQDTARQSGKEVAP